MAETNFERITKDAATLAAFFRALPVLEGPWDDEFHERFCTKCRATASESCDTCPDGEFRNNPAWWLALDTGSGADG